MADTDSKPTPAMQRYLEVKAQNPGTILLFRIGDFYELFYEDAQTAARVLGLTLTSRDKGSTNPIPMAGFFRLEGPSTSTSTDFTLPAASAGRTAARSAAATSIITRIIERTAELLCARVTSDVMG